MKLVSVNDILMAGRLIINNTAKDPEFARLMARFNFNANRMQEGENLHSLVKALQDSKKTCYDERWNIANRITQELEVLRPVFMEHVATARFAFRHQPETLNALDISRISSVRWTWIAQAEAFYAQVMAYTEQMTSYGVSEGELQQAQASVEAILALRDDRMLKKGQAESCTERKNEAAKLLKNWVKEFHATARLALKDSPQKLEAFGIRVRSLQ
jgi:hypothetical protein